MKTIKAITLALVSAMTVSCSLNMEPESYASKADIFASEDGLNSYMYMLSMAVFVR